MKLSMLDYSKLVLRKVSFDKRLFWKEYRKMCKRLTKDESINLRNWVKMKLYSPDRLVTS
jgi:hypothetical protein